MNKREYGVVVSLVRDLARAGEEGDRDGAAWLSDLTASALYLLMRRDETRDAALRTAEKGGAA